MGPLHELHIGLTARARAARQVFASAPPDVQFGAFSAIYAPSASAKGAAREALVRVDLGAVRGARARSLPVFLVLPAQDLTRCALHRTLRKGGFVGGKGRGANITDLYATCMQNNLFFGRAHIC